jgi:hypothetical protein
MNRKEQEIQILKAQIEALKSMPEGDLLGDGTDRTMTERRRSRYVAEAEGCLRTMEGTAEKLLGQWKAGTNFLFHDDFMA